MALSTISAKSVIIVPETEPEAAAVLGSQHLPPEKQKAQKLNPCPQPSWLGVVWTAGGQQEGGTGSESLKTFASRMWLLQHCGYLRKLAAGVPGWHGS